MKYGKTCDQPLMQEAIYMKNGHGMMTPGFISCRGARLHYHHEEADLHSSTTRPKWAPWMREAFAGGE
jgi:hypothetical protein